MTTLNVVRFRVKPGREEEFLEAHRNLKEPFPGMRRAWLVKTGDQTYCMVGIWKAHEDMVAARPAMITNLNKVRDCLEDLGNGLGITDPVSGDVTVELAGKERKGGSGKGGRKKSRDPERRAAKAKAGAAGATASKEEKRKSRSERKEKRGGKGKRERE